MKYFLALVCAVILFAGCRKVKYFLDDFPNPSQNQTYCRLDSIYPIVPGIPALDRTTAVGVHYNEKGNPVLLNYTFDHYGIYKIPVHYIYDAKDRLIEILPMIDETTADYLNGMPHHVKYVYEGNSKLPVRDTVFIEDLQAGNEVEELYYDAFGRVNKVIRHFTLAAQYDLETRYQYDPNGNKQVTLDFEGKTPARIEYSNKPSLYSLHPVWRIIHKDYSKNSRKSAVKTFVERGLPEMLTRNYSGYYGYEVLEAANPFTLFLGVESGVELKLEYQCPAGNTK